MKSTVDFMERLLNQNEYSEELLSRTQDFIKFIKKLDISENKKKKLIRKYTNSLYCAYDYGRWNK